ncbi:MAG: LuxR C-terminal-related transcriptional regulator [Solirubrobacteraceae bacterium]
MSATTAKRLPAPAACVIPATKFQVPRRRAEVVPREALVAAVSGRSHRLLTLLSAPAGFGKTTLLGLWHSSPLEDRPFAWLSLDESDGDPVRFWSCVIEALRTIVPDTGRAAEAALSARGVDLREVVVGLLINDVAAWEHPAVLVLDDLHLAGDARVHASLAYLLDHMPATLHLAVATREDPDLPLSRLRARDELVEIRAGHLRFSDAEAAAFLHDAFGLQLAEAQVSEIQRRTEGWAAALQLAGLSVRDRGAEAGAFPAGFAGDDAHVVDYLAGEVLAQVPDELRAFMVATSVLSRMSAGLCEAVTGDPRARQRLAELERRNLFCVSLDPQRRWYRYHPLFADVLRRELAADPERAARLHRRAATWWLAVDAVPEAISHAITAGDATLVARLVAEHWASVFNRGWLTTVSGWLAAVPEETIAADARLWLARAWTLLDSGALEESGPWLAAAADGDDPARRGWAQALSAIHRFKTGDVAGAAADAAAAADAGGASAFRETVGLLAAGLAAFWGDGARASEASFAHAARLAESDGNPLGAQYALGYLALEAAERGLLEAARERLAAVDALRDREPPVAEHFTALPAHLARARVHERAGHLDLAEPELARAVDLARRGAGIPEVAAALVAHAGVLDLVGAGDEAVRLLDEAEAVVAGCADPGRVARQLAETRRRAERGARAPAARGERLSPGEHRVLALLPSDLSLREIGDELYVSHNTVKTHVRSIYLKVGASSRSEAVSRARELRLV